MASIRTHGGDCCGRRHMFGMNGETADSIRDQMTNEGLLGDADDINKLTEIVLSGENVGLRDLQREVEAAGFTLVATWDNDSGTRCHMYLHANEWTAYPNGAAQPIVPPAPPAPAPRPVPEEPRRLVSSTYHNVYRTSGRSDAGWLTIDRARAQAARTIRIDRRDVYASGAVRWVEGVNA